MEEDLDVMNLEYDLICDFIRLRKESLRDNMADIELVLTNLGELTAPRYC